MYASQDDTQDPVVKQLLELLALSEDSFDEDQTRRVYEAIGRRVHELNIIRKESRLALQ